MIFIRLIVSGLKYLDELSRLYNVSEKKPDGTALGWDIKPPYNCTCSGYKYLMVEVHISESAKVFV